tara:strand:+ start:213 stop:1214 length:1002 start_codon:yes stop_codon:yes gene_type:complete
MVNKQKIHFLGLNKIWVPGREFHHLKEILSEVGCKITNSRIAFNSKVYLEDKYSLKKSFYHLFKNKVYFDYFHGNPLISPEFKDLFDYTLKNQNKFSKIRVTNNQIYEIFSKNGLKEKLKKIYIGVDNRIFNQIENYKKIEIKKKLNIPNDYIIVGSFQKDGVGWREGLKPKLIKGPDIFIETIKLIKKAKPNLFVLLLGPSRGFVKNELEKINVKFLHFYENDYLDMKNYYNILDFYLICSREEGGPKSLLESMACSVPVITTPVGQTVELVKNRENALITDNFSPKSLSEVSIELIEDKNLQRNIKTNCKKTALKNDYKNQILLWKDFLNV